MRFIRWLQNRVISWLDYENSRAESLLCNFDQLSYEIRPGDVLLVEGLSRVSEVIKTITQSRWSHSALYIGRLDDIKDPNLRSLILSYYHGDLGEQLIIEALLGEGTIIVPLAKYRGYHLRICRPKGLLPEDAQQVIRHALMYLGIDYDVRLLLDLARFLFPWGLLPRRWRSSLFEHNAGIPTRTVCSSMITTSFMSVNYPILPVIKQDEHGRLLFFKRNHRLFTPSDFDYSPYFEIIKYPLLGMNDLALYHHLPWSEDGLVCNTEDDCFTPDEQQPPTAARVLETIAENDTYMTKEIAADTAAEGDRIKDVN